MQYKQPLPFSMAYPFLIPFDQEWEDERDLQLMRSFYSRRAARIQEKAERECDRMEYDGSMMFDEYPDKFMMEHLCRKIERELLEEEEERAERAVCSPDGRAEGAAASDRETQILQAMNQDRNGLRDLISVLLFNEMFRRRCRRRKCRRLNGSYF